MNELGIDGIHRDTDGTSGSRNDALLRAKCTIPKKILKCVPENSYHLCSCTT